jgi:DNA-binding transcriptional LysR family regulator
MDQKRLQLFVTAAEEASLTRAARRLNMTQQNASQILRQFEAELGVRLFERGPRGLSLTEPGQTLMADARQLIALTGEVRDRVRRSAGLDKDRLRIGYPKHGSWVQAAGVLKAFREHRPQVNLEIREVSAQGRLDALVENKLDLALIFSPADQPLTLDGMLVGEALSAEDVSVIVPDSHAFADLGVVPIALLARERVIRWERSTNPVVFDRFVTACRAEGFEPPFTGFIPEAVSRDTIASLVNSGAGLCLTFRSFMDCDGWCGLAMRPLQSDNLTFTLWIVSRREDHSAPVQTFLEVVRSRYNRAAGATTV